MKGEIILCCSLQNGSQFFFFFTGSSFQLVVPALTHPSAYKSYVAPALCITELSPAPVFLHENMARNVSTLKLLFQSVQKYFVLGLL